MVLERQTTNRKWRKGGALSVINSGRLPESLHMQDLFAVLLGGQPGMRVKDLDKVRQ